jgi:hypothetical protein
MLVPAQGAAAVQIVLEALDLLRATLSRVAALAQSKPTHVRDRAAMLLAEFGPIIDGLCLRQDLDSLRYCILDLERNVRDLITGRDYDNELAPAPCPACNGACRWCATNGIVRCGACFPDARVRPAKYPQNAHA